jgi:hypothetical protein
LSATSTDLTWPLLICLDLTEFFGSLELICGAAHAVAVSATSSARYPTTL